MVNILKFWPIVVYAIAMWANTDLIIPAALAVFGSSFKMIGMVALIATVELCYGFWFWGWVVKQGPEIEKLRERRRRIRRKGLLRVVLHGVVDWVLDGVLRAYRRVTSAENGIRRHIDRWGVVAVWGLGVNFIPFVPTRAPCCAFLGFYGFRREFYHLVVANFIHVIIVIRGWGWLLGY